MAITYYELGNMGRLGNQMFQYALLLYFKLEQGREAYIPDRDIELDKCFNLTIPKTNDFSWVTHRYSEGHFHYDKGARGTLTDSTEWRMPANCDLWGYWQSEKYFKEIEGFLRAEFLFKEHIREKAKEIYNSLGDGEVVSIHVRRGDYVGNNAHPVQGDDYYTKALNTFNERECKFLVMSDDLEWCRNYHLFKKDNFVFSTASDQFIDLCLMSMCDHNIIANSSFSWWGAWLNTNMQKIVVAPAKWFGPALAQHDTKDLIPEGWSIV